MSVPESIRLDIRSKLWSKLDEMSWNTMSDSDRSTHYERWTKAEEIGGKLGHFMDPRAVRVYIKDTLVKDYTRERLLGSAERVLGALGLDKNTPVSRRYTKPHGLVCGDGRVICWGKSRDWKHLLMAAFERARAAPGSTGSSVVLIETGKTSDYDTRDLVRDAAGRLGIEKLVWWD